MLTRNNPDKQTDLEFLKRIRQGNRKKFFIAFALIVLMAVIAMTGVYYEYW
ncbi:hypothetical protein GCM10023115_51790 [Pontixanthobacter gangjinensis]|uniref:hypothetical protein n=1 Tax=Christiangramia aestuarii TaxID=1028746 RepID=UPI0012E21BEC|nr:hypothetical protein [Christiangramia aestuarii]